MLRIAQLDIVAFAVGFVLGTALRSPSWELALVGVIACAFHRLRTGARTFTVAMGFLAATANVAFHEPASATFLRSADQSSDFLLAGVLVDGPRLFEGGATYVLDVQAADHRSASGIVRLSVRGDSLLTAGQRVQVFARCAEYGPQEFPGVAGDKDRWGAHGIAGRCSAVDPPRWQSDPHSLVPWLRRATSHRRLRLERRLAALLGARAGVPIAMLTGSRGKLAESERRAHQRAGTAHLLAISGLHFGVLAGLVWMVTGWMLARFPLVTRTYGARRSSSLVVLGTMCAYLVFVGAPVSAMRAFVAVAALITGLLLGRRAAGITAVAAAAVGLLATSPLAIHDLGFQLSFAATVSIVLFWYRMPEFLAHDAYAFEPSTPRAKLQATGRFVLMSWVATAATGPILLHATGELSVVAFATNLVAVPVVSILIFPALVVGAVALEPCPVFAEPLVRVAADAMLQVTLAMEWCGELPRAVWNPGAPPGWWALLAFLLVIVVVGSAFHSKVLMLSSIAATALVAGWSLRPVPPTWRFHFIPVGQGDSTLVESPDGRRVLIDAGGAAFGPDPGQRVVVPYLRRLGVQWLDALIVTHADTDHSGGVPAVLENVPVVQVLREPAPLASIDVARWTDVGSKNNRSLVTTVRTGRASVVLPGDAEREAEVAWLEHAPRRIDILKVAHHGSRTSSSEPFLDAAAPLLGVVSAGRHSRFGHPHPAVVQRYRERATRLFDTSSNGLVLIEVTPKGIIEVRTRRPW